MKIYTTLKKISTKTVYYEKSWRILKSANQKFRDRKETKIVIEIVIENPVEKISKFFDLKNFNWIFNENFDDNFRKIFDLEIFHVRISKCSNYGSNKPFWSNFYAKLCRI